MPDGWLIGTGIICLIGLLVIAGTRGSDDDT